MSLLADELRKLADFAETQSLSGLGFVLADGRVWGVGVPTELFPYGDARIPAAVAQLLASELCPDALAARRPFLAGRKRRR